MGRAVLIVVLGFIVIFGFVNGNMNRTSDRAADNSTEFAEAVLARRIAGSAIQHAIHEIKHRKGRLIEVESGANGTNQLRP